MEVITVADYFGLPELCERLEAMNNNDAYVIRFDVCGTILKTTRATLTQDPHSRLAKMFTPGSTTSPPLTKEGAYFIDACPKAVEFILSSLRSRRLNLAARNNWPFDKSTDYVIPDDMSKKDLDVAAQRFALRVEKRNLGRPIDRLKLLFTDYSTLYHLSSF